MESHKPTISANGSLWKKNYGGIDAYGFDMMIKAISSLRSKYPKIGLAFRLLDVEDDSYYNELLRYIDDNKIKENILIIEEDLPELYPIIQKSDLFVRPTVIDGDAISIREALFLGIPVVTSDCIPRPDGVVLFKNRDIDDFVGKIQIVLENYDKYKKLAEKIVAENNANKIIAIYEELRGK